MFESGRAAIIALALGCAALGVAMHGRVLASGTVAELGGVSRRAARLWARAAFGLGAACLVGAGAGAFLQAPAAAHGMVVCPPLRLELRAPIGGQRQAGVMLRRWQALGGDDPNAELIAAAELCAAHPGLPQVCVGGADGASSGARGVARELARELARNVGAAERDLGCPTSEGAVLLATDRLDDVGRIEVPAGQPAGVSLAGVPVQLRTYPGRGGTSRLVFAAAVDGTPLGAVELAQGQAARTLLRLGPTTSVDLWARLDEADHGGPVVTLFRLRLRCT